MTTTESLPWLDSFLEGAGSFLVASDMHTVFVITAIALLLKYYLWPYWRWPLAYLAFVPLALSFVITPLMSSTAEVQWGGQWFFRQAFYNGVVSEIWFHVGLPYCYRKWPHLFSFLSLSNGGSPT